MDETVTNLASRWKRLCGFLIDGIIMMAIAIPVMFSLGVQQQLMNEQQIAIGLQAKIFLITWLIFLLLNGYLLYKKGQTIGKVVVKIRIVDLNGNIPEFVRLLVLRYLVLILVSQIPILGSLALFVNELSIFGKERRCIHDYVAGTRVINT